MLNLKLVKWIYSKVNIKYFPKTRLNQAMPREKNIKLIFSEIGRNKSIDRNRLILKTGISKSCLSRVLFYLLESGKITRKDIGRSGSNKIYSYSVVTL